MVRGAGSAVTAQAGIYQWADMDRTDLGRGMDLPTEAKASE